MRDDVRYVPKGIASGVSMSERTSFGVGGEARFFAEVSAGEDIPRILDWAARNTLPVYPLGDGTNILAADDGVDALVLRLDPAGEFGRVEFVEGDEGPMVCAGGAAKAADVLDQCVEKGLAGLEFLAGIPGTVGGAVASNAGGKAGKVDDVLVGFDGLPLSFPSNEVYNLTRSRDAEEFLVLRACFRLERSTPEEVRNKVRGILEHRRKSQPVGVRSAGCVFRNPPRGGMSAGELIERAGLKGERRGGAVISEKHANWIVNAGEATAMDILALAMTVVERVRAEFGVQLAFEIDLWGESLEEYLVRERYLG